MDVMPWLIHVEASRTLSAQWWLNLTEKNHIDYFDRHRTSNWITGMYKLNSTEQADNNHLRYDHIDGGSSIYYDEDENMWHISYYYLNFGQSRKPPIHGWQWSELTLPVPDPGLVLHFYPEELTSPPAKISLKSDSGEVSGSYSLLATTHNQFPIYRSKRRFLYVRKYTNNRYL